MDSKRILFLFPNTSNNAAIPNGITILAGIAKSLSYEREYFDTHNYEKTRDSMQDRETTGEFKPSGYLEGKTFKPFNQIIVDLQNKIDMFKPQILAISCMSFEYDFLLTFYPEIHMPENTLVLIGGIHAILKPEEIMSSGYFDIVCTGEGEEPFNELLLRFEKGESLEDIKNFHIKDRIIGNIVKNQRSPLLSGEALWRWDRDYSFFDEKYFSYPFDGKVYNRCGFEVSRVVHSIVLTAEIQL